MDNQSFFEPIGEDYQDFLELVLKEFPKYLTSYDVEKLYIEKVDKNNGIEHTGIVVCLKGDTVSPNIYMEYYYTLYKQGKSMDEIMPLIEREHIFARERMDKDDIVIDYENFRDKVFVKLVNYERNKELLEKCPYIPYLDLAITYRYLVKQDENGIASCLLSYDNIENMDVSMDELKDIAYENTKRIFKPSFMDAAEVTKKYGNSVDTEDNGLYVLTNEQCINGSTSMVFSDVLKEISDKIGAGYYLLPSSINELMIVPHVGKDKEEYMLSLVKEVNSVSLSKTEFLSDNIYWYDREKGKLRLIEASDK